MVDINKLFNIDPVNKDFPASSPSKKRIEAMEVLLRAHKDRAGEEALFRALTAEKIDDTKTSFFWIGVFVEIKAGKFKA